MFVFLKNGGIQLSSMEYALVKVTDCPTYFKFYDKIKIVTANNRSTVKFPNI